MLINIQYFAILREQRGCGQETIETSATTAKELYNELWSKHNFSVKPDLLRVAINDEFQGWETVLKSGDQIVFVPPVAGG